MIKSIKFDTKKLDKEKYTPDPEIVKAIDEVLREPLTEIVKYSLEKYGEPPFGRSVSDKVKEYKQIRTND